MGARGVRWLLGDCVGCDRLGMLLGVGYDKLGSLLGDCVGCVRLGRMMGDCVGCGKCIGVS